MTSLKGKAARRRAVGLLRLRAAASEAVQIADELPPSVLITRRHRSHDDAGGAVGAFDQKSVVPAARVAQDDKSEALDDVPKGAFFACLLPRHDRLRLVAIATTAASLCAGSRALTKATARWSWWVRAWMTSEGCDSDPFPLWSGTACRCGGMPL